MGIVPFKRNPLVIQVRGAECETLPWGKIGAILRWQVHNVGVASLRSTALYTRQVLRFHYFEIKMDELGDIIQKILNPVQEDADVLLEETGFGVIPSSETVHQEIESKLLSPPDTLPEHWLSIYQMCDSS